jgi:acetyl esterase/lipase
MVSIWPEIEARAADRPNSLVLPPLPSRLPEAWHRAERIELWSDEPPGAENFHERPRPEGMPEVLLSNVDRPCLRVFRPEQSNGHGLLVIPGGSYEFVSVANEGIDVAKALCPHGYVVFVLTYRLPGEGWANRADVPLQDAQRAMRVIRDEAGRFGIGSDSVDAIGFSAGGHLAASLAVGYGETVYPARDGIDELSAKPRSAALIYPVITMDRRWTHEASRQALLGESPSEADIVRRSPNRCVNESTAPAFIVHALDDPAVPVKNSLLMFEAMRKVNRQTESHFFQEGGHAFGVGIPGSSSALWPELYMAWTGRLSA